MSCTADITTAIKENVVTVPIQALTVREFETDPEGNLVRPSKDAGEQKEAAAETAKEKAKRKDFEGVFVVRDGKAVFEPVSTGITGDTNVEIVSGLQEGDVIVTGSYKALRTLKDGDAVKIEKKEKGQE